MNKQPKTAREPLSELPDETPKAGPSAKLKPVPFVSVVIPVYNPDHRQLLDCLSSVLNQNIASFEVIAVNDGSPDKTILPILKETAREYPHLRVVNQRNAGGAAAINRGIKAARGEYLTVMDHDDIMLSGALEKLYAAAKVANADMATGRLQRLEGQADFWPSLTPLFEKKRVVERSEYDPLLLRNTHYYNWIYRRKFFKKHVGIIKKRIVADFEMMHLMIPNANRVAVIPQTVYLWRRTENSITSTRGFFRDRVQVIRDILAANADKPASYKSAFFKTIAERLSWYEPKYFDLLEPERTELLALCLFEAFADLSASDLDPQAELNAAPLSAHQRKLFALALTNDADQAVLAFRKESIRRAEVVTRRNEAAKAPNKQETMSPAVNSGLGTLSTPAPSKLYKAKLTTAHIGKLALEHSKALAMQYGFPRIPEAFGVVSRLRKRGYRGALQAAEARTTQSRKAVMFESFLGKQYGGNPRAIYEYMLEHHPDYEFYWCYSGDPADIPGNPTIVRRETAAYWDALARCHKLVNNIVFPNWLYGEKKRYLQTWHGTPLKRLGFDIKISGHETQGRYGFFNESRNWDGLISANSYSSKNFKRAFRFRKEMLTIGYPANDIFYHPDRMETTRGNVRNKLNIPADAQVFLYAPTWRDNKAVGNWLFSFDLTPDFSAILDKSPPGSVVLLRQHHLTENQKKQDDPRLIDVSKYPDAHELMVASDILISDYSSIAFDWACSRKPVIFYTPDYDEYARKARGFYLDMENDLGAQLVTTHTDLTDVILNRRWENAGWQKQADVLYDLFCKLHDGTASKQATDWLLKDVGP